MRGRGGAGRVQLHGAAERSAALLRVCPPARLLIPRRTSLPAPLLPPCPLQQLQPPAAARQVQLLGGGCPRGRPRRPDARGRHQPRGGCARGQGRSVGGAQFGAVGRLDERGGRPSCLAHPPLPTHPHPPPHPAPGLPGVDYYRTQLQVPEEAYELNFVFSNGDGMFDNNNTQVGCAGAWLEMEAPCWRALCIAVLHSCPRLRLPPPTPPPPPPPPPSPHPTELHAAGVGPHDPGEVDRNRARARGACAAPPPACRLPACALATCAPAGSSPHRYPTLPPSTPQEAAWKAKKEQEAKAAAEAAAAEVKRKADEDARKAAEAVADLKGQYKAWREGAAKQEAGRWRMVPSVRSGVCRAGRGMCRAALLVPPCLPGLLAHSCGASVCACLQLAHPTPPAPPAAAVCVSGRHHHPAVQPQGGAAGRL